MPMFRHRFTTLRARITYCALPITYLVCLISIKAQASLPKRISAQILDRTRVERVSLSPGLASIVWFPCDIAEAIVGRSEDLKAQVSPTSKRTLILHLSSSASLPTNLLVRCGPEEEHADPFVFDIVPSKVNHQDYVKVERGVGGPRAVEDKSATKSALEERQRRHDRQAREDEELRALIRKTRE